MLSDVFETCRDIFVCRTNSLDELTNSFVPNAPFLYPLKISENRNVF